MPRLPGAQRRTRILQAAAQAFAAHGYHATSMREIAQRAGITKPILYDHFASKEQLYVALIESVRDELTSGTAAHMGSGGLFEARLRDAIDTFFRYVEGRPAEARVLFTAPEGERVVVEAARRVQNEATARLAALLAAEDRRASNAAERELRLAVCTEFLKRGLHGLANWWSDNPTVDRSVLVDAVMQLVWTGLRSQFNARSD